MMSTLTTHAARLGLGPMGALGATLACIALACNGDGKPSSSASSLFEAPSSDPQGALFGGEPEEPAPSAPASPCDAIHSSPDILRIDDFEDGDAQIHRVFERDGWWWVSTDETSGDLIPARGAERPATLPEGGLAMHFAAAGFSEWGAILGMSLEWAGEGVTCAFNAAAYEGFRFRAKGAGSLPVQVALPETNGPEGDARSKCADNCWDHYQVVLQLTQDWSRHEVRWADLQQGGWGKAVPFDAEHLLGILFSPKPEDLPIDAWIDDIEFIPR